MRIDPVIALVDELNTAYVALARARKQKDWSCAHRALVRANCIRAALHEAEPTSVIGAGYLLREAGALLVGSRQDADATLCAVHLRQTATRMERGARAHGDLVWLRQLHRALAGGWYGTPGKEAAVLVALALKGAARPLLFYRATVAPAKEAAPARREPCPLHIMRDVS